MNVSHEYRLMGKLLDGYEQTARPRYNSSEVVDILVRFSLQQIYDLVSSTWVTSPANHIDKIIINLNHDVAFETAVNFVDMQFKPKFVYWIIMNWIYETRVIC